MQALPLWSLFSRFDLSNLFLVLHWFLYLSFLVTFFILIPAALNRSLGVLRFYCFVLTKIFDYGGRKLKQNKKTNAAAVSKTKDIDSDLEDSIAGKENPEDNVIQREPTVGLTEYCRQLYEPAYERLIENEELHLSDISFYVKSGIESIVQDDVIQRFETQELKSWNFLTRNNASYRHMGVRISLIWIVGWVFRYFILFPLRLCIFVVGVGSYSVSTCLVSFIPRGPFKDKISKNLSLMSYRVLCRGFSAIIRFHNRENMSQGGGVCVANHTSPIDAIILSCDNCYVLSGQRHGGFTGFMQSAMSKLASHVWFERSKMADRANVVKVIAEHAADPSKAPILIFPEGTCINNTSVMMFRKGSFEYSDVIYPLAIKYDPRFGDAFWNSSKHSMLRYLLHMMTSWAIVCDVWYLPPCKRLPNEEVIDFAYRVKQLIAHQGG